MKSSSPPPPRLVNIGEAAAYCGLSATTFLAVCPVPPIALGEGARMRRYDVRALDAWIDCLSVTTAPAAKNWLDTIG